ncbi:fatty acid-binding protein 2-like [Ostrinia nubilalis]|uniref:fatty acid-binding protein 2-like n=1 Tax=Ostrinia nubilalis TaxID=29057 RepID=UPI0030825C71
MTTMDDYLGKSYVMISEDNFEAYLEYLGMGYIKRKIAVKVRPTQTLRRNASGTYTFSVHGALFHWEIMFTPGVEFDATSPDDIQLKGLITFEGNVMTHKQTDNEGRVSTHKLEFGPEVTIVTTTVEGWDIVATRIYKLVK